MRRVIIWLGLAICLVWGTRSEAATGKVKKVLPEFLDTKGRNSLSPSLYERDAYQVTLRDHPERRSAMRFYVQWKTKGAAQGPLTIRIELRGIAQGALPKELVVQTPAEPRGWFSHWTTVTLT